MEQQDSNSLRQSTKIRNASYHHKIRATGVCIWCRKPLPDDDPRLAHTACNTALRAGVPTWKLRGDAVPLRVLKAQSKVQSLEEESRLLDDLFVHDPISSTLPPDPDPKRGPARPHEDRVHHLGVDRPVRPRGKAFRDSDRFVVGQPNTRAAHAKADFEYFEGEDSETLRVVAARKIRKQDQAARGLLKLPNRHIAGSIALTLLGGGFFRTIEPLGAHEIV